MSSETIVTLVIIVVVLWITHFYWVQWLRDTFSPSFEHQVVRSAKSVPLEKWQFDIDSTKEYPRDSDNHVYMYHSDNGALIQMKGCLGEYQYVKLYVDGIFVIADENSMALGFLYRRVHTYYRAQLLKQMKPHLEEAQRVDTKRRKQEQDDTLKRL